MSTVTATGGRQGRSWNSLATCRPAGSFSWSRRGREEALHTQPSEHLNPMRPLASEKQHAQNPLGRIDLDLEGDPAPLKQSA